MLLAQHRERNAIKQKKNWQLPQIKNVWMNWIKNPHQKKCYKKSGIGRQFWCWLMIKLNNNRFMVNFIY